VFLFWEEALNDEQVGLVQQTWATLKPVSNTAAELFYSRLFEIDSSTRDLFENDMHDQGELLMGMIEVVVALLVKTDLSFQHCRVWVIGMLVTV
jgi:hemoglobin-like flavoprotein